MATLQPSAGPWIAGTKAAAAAVAIVAVLLLAALSVTAAAGADTGAQAGAAIYKDKCVGCHGADGSGNTPVGKALKVKDVRQPDVQAMKDADLATLIMNGKGKMPAQRGKLTAAQVDEVVAYVRSLAKSK